MTDAIYIILYFLKADRILRNTTTGTRRSFVNIIFTSVFYFSLSFISSGNGISYTSLKRAFLSQTLCICFHSRHTSRCRGRSLWCWFVPAAGVCKIMHLSNGFLNQGHHIKASHLTENIQNSQQFFVLLSHNRLRFAVVFAPTFNLFLYFARLFLRIVCSHCQIFSVQFLQFGS